MMILSSHYIGISMLSLHCISVIAYSPSASNNYHRGQSHHRGVSGSIGSSSISPLHPDVPPRTRPLHLGASPMDVVLETPVDIEDTSIVVLPKKARKSSLNNSRRVVTNVQQQSQITQLKSVRRPASPTMRKLSPRIKLQNVSIKRKPKLASNSKRRTKQNGDQIYSDQTSRKRNTHLTSEEEITLTSQFKKLKSVLKIQGELTQMKSAEKDLSDRSALSTDKIYMTEELRRSHPAYEYQPTDEEWAKACGISLIQLRRILISGRNARTRLVDGNAGLVMNIAQKYFSALRRSVEGSGSNGVGSILTLQDMVQEGTLGLIEAAERFDSTKGARFSTYAVYWVKQRILRSITDNSRVIRLPAHVHTMLRTIRRTSAEMEKEIGRTPSLPELAHELNMAPDKLRLYTASSRSVLSLEVPRGSGTGGAGKSGGGDQDKRTLGDFIASDSPTPQEDAENDALKRDIRAAIDGLGNDRERDVLIWRFGLEDGNPRTVGETANILGLTKDRIRMTEARALNKLRHSPSDHRLKDYVGEHHHRSAEEVGGNFYESFNPRSGFETPDKAKKDTLAMYSPQQIWGV